MTACHMGVEYMPTGTFFRLPEEKRMRLVESAWEEFTHISYADVSINKIIQAAGIPRGSFYQYFDGKEDLFFYLLDDVRNHFIRTLKSFLLDVDGDLFCIGMLGYDQFLQRRERGDLRPRRCIQILRSNPGMAMFQTFSKPPFYLPDELFPLIDTAQFRSRVRNFVESAFFLSIMCLISVIMDTFAHMDRAALQRTVLRERFEIVKRGCLLPCQEAPQQLQGGKQV